MDLNKLEKELKKRLSFPYKWGSRQTDAKDKATNFIYETSGFEALLRKSKQLDDSLRNYAFNRWYNFWSAMAVENIFVSHANIQANKNHRDKLIDFKINNIPFDHKTTVFPKRFNKTYADAIKNKKELILWLYSHQSQEGRKHLKNRLFIVLYDGRTEAHWKMKAEIGLLKSAIDQYLRSFSKNKLFKLDFGDGEVLSDIIWVQKEIK